MSDQEAMFKPVSVVDLNSPLALMTVKSTGISACSLICARSGGNVLFSFVDESLSCRVHKKSSIVLKRGESNGAFVAFKNASIGKCSHDGKNSTSKGVLPICMYVLL